MPTGYVWVPSSAKRRPPSDELEQDPEPFIDFEEISIDHRSVRQPSLAYLGPLASDGYSPAPASRQNEARSVMMLEDPYKGNFRYEDSTPCMVFTRWPVGVTLHARRKELSWKPDNLEGHSATRVGPHVLVYGGLHSNGDVLREYTISTDRWRVVEREEGAVWPGGKLFHSAFTLGGKLYIVGGHKPKVPLCRRFSPITRDCWVFDPSTRVWTQLEDAPCLLVHSDCCVCGDTAHIFGGECKEYSISISISISISQ
ncbi:hypothetical protein KIPB_012275 [Kipferlia bialata]|uniref:Kelch repeat type 1 n=1 Tax=Kipferlia bialata TaxID=797122 RepID=A0A9K3GPE9_9EUKA|nr:hypothetical protein KIPB_012275 [Kipferlia bialata]|eukprot:g12275.t1